MRGFIVVVGLLVRNTSLRVEFSDCFEAYSFPNEARPEAKFLRCYYEALHQRMGQRESENCAILRQSNSDTLVFAVDGSTLALTAYIHQQVASAVSNGPF